ncbi:hypothetical protein FGG08_006384 [Glutinoglossum americanum]|uniref:Uncharacterized protein n=1 Tax=Glutinoglossum americanum TaxID=1670608 RepID=A0A9P8I1N5_9PEZI|nr:hypothetical protein FGG08_006384 [Glutinoglossum americanum]
MAARAPASKYIFLAGAPDATSLSWETSDLAVGFSPQLTRYLAGVALLREDQSTVQSQEAGDGLPAWRLLPLVRQHLETGFTPASPAKQDGIRWEDQEISFHVPKNGEKVSFFTTSGLSLDEAQGQAGQGHASLPQIEDEILSQFYEHSLALHEVIPSESPSVPEHASIEINSVGQSLENSDTAFATSSFDSSSLDGDTSFIIASPQQQRPAAPVLPPTVRAALIHDLDDIPNAAYLYSITPQAMIVNLIVGILDIKPPRLVKTRRGTGVEMEIVEILVGDETRSGFGINFWLWPEQSEAAKKTGGKKQQRHNQSESLRDILNQLRPQDIILVRNVALSSFRDQVYGQLFRMDPARLYLLYRNPVRSLSGEGDNKMEETPCIYHPSDLVGKEGIAEDPQTRKVRRVRDWVLHFVAGPAPAMARHTKGKDGLVKGGGYLAGDESAMMPPDTPL